MTAQNSSGFWISPQQAHIWMEQPAAPGWNALSVGLIEGALDSRRLRDALSTLVSRHETLRTVFRRVPGMKVPFQTVLPTSEFGWEETSFVALDEGSRRQRVEELAARERRRQFDLENGPVLHVCLARTREDEWALLLSVPALNCDLRSLRVLTQDLLSMYSGQFQEPAEEPLRYVQFAQWQRSLGESTDEDAQQAREFWGGIPADLPAPVLPLESARAGEFSPAAVERILPQSVTRNIESVAGPENVSAFLLAAWQTLIWRLSGQTVFLTGFLCDGREFDQLEDMAGQIGKTLPLEARFEADYRFQEVFETVGRRLTEAAGWQEYFLPSDSQPAAAIHFDFEDLPQAQPFGDLRLTVVRQEVFSEPFKLKLCARRMGASLGLELQYDASLFDRAAIESVTGYFETLLAAAAENPQLPVSRLRLLPAADRNRLLVEWNRADAPYPHAASVAQLFEAQAARTPDRPAVRCGDRELTYEQLNQQANQWAHALRRLGVGPDSRVGLCVDRSVEMVAALLGILKAGGAYLPLSADHPQSRLARQMAGAAALVTQEKFLPQMSGFGGPVVCLDRDQGSWSREPDTNPEPQAGPENLVYVIFTSGSTGVPKGVAVRHRNLVNYAHYIQQRLELEKYPEGLHFATVSTLSADLGNTCIYPSLLSGGCLHVIPSEVASGSQQMVDYARRYPLDVLKIVPSHLAALLDAADARGILPRRFLVLGGEALHRRLLDRIAGLGAGCEILNHYGPTETTVGSLTLLLRDGDPAPLAGNIPIGRPIANTRVYILDRHSEPVPPGVSGELYIGGAGVAAGYLDQPELTAERFVPDPFAGDTQAKMYRTGDMARYLADGTVEFLGRADDQVKIRGFRIELGEIESALAGHRGVKEAAVLALEDETGDKRLVAYVVANAEFGAGGEDLRNHLRAQLPDYMVPAAIVTLPKLPLNANGKLDRRALPTPEEAESAKRPYVPPSGVTEEAVAEVWAEVLRRPEISVEENFFDLGGHSLLATQIASRLHERFHTTVAVRLLFDHPTIRELARAIDAARQENGDEAEPEMVAIPRRARKVPVGGR